MQFIDLKAQYQALKAEINESIQAVLDDGRYIGGPQVKELEVKLAEYVGRKHCISCANGTDALQIAFMVYGIGEGDAVFCPDITFIASTEPSKMLGATSVFCDIQPDTYNLCPESLERQIKAVLAEGKLTPKAVIAVDIPVAVFVVLRRFTPNDEVARGVAVKTADDVEQGGFPAPGTAH